MNKITFPSLNLEFNISKVAISISSIQIYWYAIFIVLGLLCAILLFKIKNNKFGIKYQNILELLIIIIPISLICARIYYVLFNLKYFLNEPIQILNIRSGGMAIYGGIIGGAITAYIYCKNKKISFLDLMDYIVPGLALRTSNW